MAAAFDPYHKWLGIPADQQPPNCYRLLGIRDFEDDPDVIQAAADQRTTHLRSFQAGPHAELAAPLLNEVLQARNRLLDADDKTEYDAQLRDQQPPIPTRSASEGQLQKPRTWPDGKAPSSVEEFHQCLEASRVMSADDSRRFLTSLPEFKRPDTAKNLAIELLKAGKLTRHQAENVLKGKIKYLAFGEYIILEKLGQGGMGQVFKAEHRRMRRTVALKVISGPLMKDAETVRRFQREVHAAARLIHPNIVTAFDANEHEGVHFFVMEYVEGRDLAELVNDQGPLPVAQAVDYVLQAARGLAYAHGKGIVHRDIKPANLLLDDEGTVKILDMGLARMELSADDGQELTNTGQVMGTIDYMAPEQAEDTHAVDARADIYSLGCTLYRLLAGQVLYSGDTVVKKLLAHRSKPVPFLGTVCKGIPRALEATFQKMVAKRPEDRQPTMAHVVSELEACLRSSSPSGTFPRSTESTIDFPLTDILNTQTRSASEGSDRSHSDRSSSAAIAPRAEKTQSAGTEVTQDFTKGDTGTSLDVGWDKVAPAAAGPPSVAATTVGRRSLRSLAPPYAKWIAAALASLALLAAGIVIFLPANAQRSITTAVAEPAPNASIPAQQSEFLNPKSPIPNPKSAPPPPAIAPFDAAQARAHQEAWANHLGIPVEQTNSIGMKLRLIPPGEFMMGSSDEEVESVLKLAAAEREGLLDKIRSEAPQRRNTIGQAYCAGATEVTVAQFRQFVKSADYTTDAERLGGGLIDWKKGVDPSAKWDTPLGQTSNDAAAVSQVTWNDCLMFCNWLSVHENLRPCYRLEDSRRWVLLNEADGYRLPSEAEWEYSCRSGSTTRYSFGGDQEALAEYVSKNRDLGVANRRPNAFGLFDMHGNLQEFCQDNYDRAMSQAFDAEASFLSVRGGSSFHPILCRSAYRAGYGTRYRSPEIGFRVVRTLAIPPPNPKSKIENPKSASPDFALEFNGNDSYVDLPTLRYDGSHPITLEATIIPYRIDSRGTVIGDSHRGGMELNFPHHGGNSPTSGLFGVVEKPKETIVWTRNPLQPRQKLQVAAVRESSIIRLFIDGVFQSAAELKGSYPPGQLPFTIGAATVHRGTEVGNPFCGLIDELRISKVARYTADFTPLSRFEPDSNTLALYHFDEGRGDILTDSSGNNHHGKIVNAKWVRTDTSASNPQSPIPNPKSSSETVEPEPAAASSQPANKN